MSSFFEDVLAVTDEKEAIDLTQKIDIIKKEVTKLKVVINHFMEDKCSELELDLKPDEILVNNSEKLIHDMKTLNRRINEQVKVALTSSSKELQSLSQELKEYNYSLSLTNHLLEIYKGFQAIENCKVENEKQYFKIAITLVNLRYLIIENSLDIQQLDIYKAIKEEYIKTYDNFISEMTTSWDEIVTWTEPMSGNPACLHIKQTSDKVDIIQALHCLNKLMKCIESLSTNLLQYFIFPIIHYECVVHKENIFFVEITDRKKQPMYKTVLSNLQLLFEFLHDSFNIIIQDQEYFLSRLSNSMFDQFSRLLVNDWISKIIPTSNAELETFKATVFEIDEFQNYLVHIKFINEEQKFLSKYTSNVDKFYIDKKCEKLFELARSIMKKDLHDSFRYTPKPIINFISDKDNEGNILIDRKLSKDTFNLPECQISKSVQELLYLVEEILEEACHSLDTCALRFFYISRNIFEMYAALVPEIHKSFLETIPQQVALFHNNCIYLAHHLLTLAYKYKTKIILPEDFLIIYIDQALHLREVAAKHFLNHMKYQRDIILDILRESGLSSIGQMPELPSSTERALRQCIRQLELLKTVWIEILPIKMYCRVVGCIVNDMADDICSKLIGVEDIPADVASELVTLLNMVVKRIPQIFPNPALIYQHVLKWRRLKELIIVLGASLKEIEDRWADGKGPLANEFMPQHVKQLIRALFQNTERRSNLLSKIKEKS